jgi:hypothetical protein
MKIHSVIKVSEIVQVVVEQEDWGEWESRGEGEMEVFGNVREEFVEVWPNQDWPKPRLMTLARPYFSKVHMG